MDDLTVSLAKTIFEENIDIIQEYAEITIDSVLNESLLREIPLVGTAVGIGKVVISIRDRNFLKNTIIFMKKLSENSIDRDVLQKHVKLFEKNENRRKRELECIALYLDNYVDCTKSKLLANIYTSLIKEEIDWEDFKVCTEILDSIKVTDLATLRDIYEKKKYLEGDNYYPLSLKRLDGIGVVQYFNEIRVTQGKDRKSIKASISPAGEAFVDIAMSNIDITEDEL